MYLYYIYIKYIYIYIYLYIYIYKRNNLVEMFYTFYHVTLAMVLPHTLAKL